MRKIKDILISNGFKFNHRLGQNFITDTNLLNKIVELSGVSADDTVVEIGTGAGTLTRALAETARKVYSFEVDENLRPVLDETLDGLDNAEVVFKDVLKMSDDELKAITGGNFKVVANIPYYITTPLIMRFLERGLRPSSITVTVQKEVAERLVAKENTAEYGAITAVVRLYGGAYIAGRVDKNMFYPAPKVDSCVVRIDLSDKYGHEDKELICRIIKSAFAMRRKTFANNLISSFGFTKAEAENLLTENGFDIKIRGEALSPDDFIKLSRSKIFLPFKKG